MSTDKVKKSIFKRWWFWVIIVVVIIIAAASSSGGGSSSATSKSTGTTTASAASSSADSTSSKPSAPSSGTQSPTIGQFVTVDKFAVKVNSMKYLTQIPDGGTNMAPSANGGEWLVLNVTIKNNDSTSRTIDSSLFTLMKGSTKYDASSDADMFINNQNDFFLTQVNPGLSTTGNIAFNVPSQGSYQLQVSSGLFGSSSVNINLKK